LLTGAFTSGLTAQALGTAAPGKVLVIVHGVIGLSVLLLSPWKTKVAQTGIARRNSRRTISLVLAGLAVVVLITGVLHSTGIVGHIGPFTVLWVHVASALLLIPILVWHFFARQTTPRTTDLARRNLLRLSGLTSAAAIVWLGLDKSVALAQLPGSRRRFSGSHERSSFIPETVPVTSWLDDRIPDLSASSWQLAIDNHVEQKVMTLEKLNSLLNEEFVAELDCTSGWYTSQVWSGVRLDSLIDRSIFDEAEMRSIGVWSATGYVRRFPVHDLERLWLVTEMGGAPLSPGHGFPARLVAPDRRGFWWVKWVVRIETSPIPWWLQLPYPAT
jgi:DMSO/TMAO reductase YedYZ molybdopterin-dependent catalytic subunit